MTDEPANTPGNEEAGAKKLTPQMRRVRRLRNALQKVDEALAAQGMADQNPARKLIHDALKPARPKSEAA